MKTIRRPISILLAVLMVVGMFTVLPITASAAPPESGSSGSMETGTTITPSAAKWTFKLNSNFSGEWNADTDVVSEQPVELNLAAGDYEFQIVAYEDGNLSSYRGNVQAGSFTETYSQVMHDNGGNAKFHADGGKYTLTYNAGDGVLTINPVYVAEIDGTNYKTLEAAFAAAQDGDTITLLANCAGNGIKAPQGKFANNGLTVDFAGFTYTVDGETVGSTGTETNGFQLLKGNNINFLNGTIYSEKAKILVQNYSNLGLYDMTLTLNNTSYNGAYTLSNNNGNAGIHNTTINANPAGGFAFDVCRYSSYPSINVEVTGNSVINGNVEISASNGVPKDGFSLTLSGGTMNGNIVVDPSAQTAIENYPEKAVVTKANTFTQTAPEGFEWKNNSDGTSTLVALPYAAKINDTKYRTLEEAFAAAQDGDTITLLADCTGNGIKVPTGKFATGLTVDFDDWTYTIDGETVGSTGTETNGFQLLKDNKITFKNGTITSAKAKILVQNYSDLTLLGMTLTLDNPNYTSAYTLSNNNGDVVIDSTTINANPAGGFAFDVCRFSSYPSVHVTVKGGSDIQGDVEISASKGQAKEGFSLTLESGSMSGDIVVDASAQALVGEENKVTKANTFTQEAPEGYEWKDNGDGTSTLAHVHDWDYENVTWTFTENTSHSIYAKYTLTCKTDPTHTKEQTGSGTLMSTVAVDGDKFVYTHAAVKIDGNSVAVPNYTRNVADGIINQYELKAAVKVAGEYKLANDITGFYDNVKPVDGFVLDGQNHMIKYGTINAGGRVMFVAADQNTKFTLKNITLDGNNRAKWAVCAYTDNGGKNAGNVITLDTVTIQNFKSNDYVGAINAFGSSTWNLKDCTITGNTTVDDSDGLSGSAVWAGSKATINIDGGTYDEVYLHSYSGTGAVLNADGGATIDNLVLDLTKTDTLKANIDDATVGAITSNEGTIPEEAVVMDPDKATVAAPEGYKWVDSDETGMKTLAQIVYVAQIGETKYETLEEAFAAAVDGDTITVLADSAGNGIKVTPAGKFATGLTVDFDGHTYTVDGETVGSPGTETLAFQLLKNNKVTFKNGTIYSEKAKMLVQNYCDLTLDNMTLTLNNSTYNGAYTLSNNNGNVVINDTTINANPTPGSFAFDVCRYGKKNTYPSVNVTVTGDSEINGNVEIFATNSDPKDGFSLNLNGGTMSGEIIVTPSAAAAMESAPEKVSVNKAADFDQAAPEGYMWVDTETEGVQTIAKAVAQIGETKYASLEAAFAAAVDGDTIKVLADSAGNGIKVLKNKFKTNGLTVDFDGHTYTMDGETVGSPGTETLAFQLQYNNKITFKNGTLYSEKALFLVQNYSNLTLDNMELTLKNPNYAYGYTLSNNYGNTVIKDTTINANPAGKFAFDVCRGGGSDRYTYVNVTVEGNSVINGNVEVDARNGDPKNGFSLNLESGTLNGDIKLTADAETAIDNNPDRASVNKQNTFNQDPAAGYKWKDNGDGTSTLVKADLFAGYGLTLHGDIGLIFYLDPAAVGVDAANVSSVSVSFTCDKYTGTVTDFTREGDYIKVAYYVPAAYMASPVHAYSVTINGVTSNEINDYTVQEYALRVIADPSLISDDETTQNNAVKLMKEMLNYGAKAKAVFQTQMSAPEAAVYETIPEYTMATVTPDMIDAAIKGEATDMSTVHPEADANFYAPSVIYLSKTTLRMVFLIPTGNGSTCPEEYSGSQAPWYYWKDVTDIPAAELDEQQQFEINGVTFHYSVLDYAKAVVAGGSSAQKDLAASLYLYNQAANAFFAD